MSETTRATVYLEPRLYRAAKIKAVSGDRSFSEVVNEALRLMLREDQLDLQSFDERARQPARSFEAVLRSLKDDGLL